jgi:hypothetical protein
MLEYPISKSISKSSQGGSMREEVMKNKIKMATISDRTAQLLKLSLKL